MSRGAIAGIIVAGITVVVILGVMAVIYLRKKCSSRSGTVGNRAMEGGEENIPGGRLK